MKARLIHLFFLSFAVLALSAQNETREYLLRNYEGSPPLGGDVTLKTATAKAVGDEHFRVIELETLEEGDYL